MKLIKITIGFQLNENGMIVRMIRRDDKGSTIVPITAIDNHCHCRKKGKQEETTDQ